MQKSISQNVNIPTLNGKPLSLQESHQKAGMRMFQCSDYLSSMSLFAGGEFSNKGSRKAMVVVTDLKTGALKGCGEFVPFEKHLYLV